MNVTMKSILILAGLIVIPVFTIAQSSPDNFLDDRAQAMVHVIRSNQSLYVTDPKQFKSKINTIFEPMVDFRRVGASVMGKKYYIAATKDQRVRFISVFKTSLLDTYSSTLAQWGDQTIKTDFSEKVIFKKTEDVNQSLITSNNIYPITYKVRNDGKGNWLIINIIVNGVNLGLTFRNQFQALALEHNENIDEIINHWTSDANL
jgi:phospholipid transport system substrate-binding protein|tara:strand:- start:2777 stop:3388 length:612 start_codon:yes stop_codon:yes gene_type:complete